MARKGLYRGYSSFEFLNKGTFKINDVETVKLDLLNHIFTRRGERVMMPTFGTIIPDLVFEPLDEPTLELLYTELEQVFNFDPRVELLSMTITPAPDENSVTAEAVLRYIELNLVEEFNINIDFESAL